MVFVIFGNWDRIGKGTTECETLKITIKLNETNLKNNKKQSIKEYLQVVDGLKTALAEQTVKESLTVAVQEPVAWKHPDKNMVFWEDTKKVDEYHGFKLTIPLYTAPPRREWVGLTDEEIDEIGKAVIGFNSLSGWENEFGLAIESKLKEKNT